MLRTMLYLALATLLLGGCATFRAGAPPGVVEVIAHRGASHNAPENTLAAFRLAHDMGAHWFELDCYLTCDNKVIVIHDATLERTTGVEGRVADLTMGELKSLDAGSWKSPDFAGETLPTLGEALDFARNRIGVYVEIKNMADDTALMARLLEIAVDHPFMTPSLAREMLDAIEADGTRNLELTRRVIDAIRSRGMEDAIVLQSFSPVICAVARLEAPDLRVELLSGVEFDHHADWELVTRWAFLLDTHGVNLSAKGLTPGRLAVIQGAGKRAAVWTVNDPTAMRQFARWGVDAIITDRPDVCLRVLNRK